MHAGRQTQMRRGAIWACVIPVGLGLIALVITAIFLRDFAATKGVGVMGVALASFGIISCFIFGTPLAAWIACRSLAKIEPAEKLSRWRSSAVRGLWSASLVQFVWASFYTFGLIADSSGNVTLDFSVDYGAAWVLRQFMASMWLNVFVWILITLPLSLICATIFWRVTKFPSDTNVF